jgi:cation-transporting ATPase E
MLYIVITVLLVMAKSWTNLTFLAVIIPNTVLGIFQEFKAKKIIERLNLVTAPHAIVVRDGEKKEIDTKEVVLDDIIRFATGNQISADSIVRSGFVEVNESMITGEPDAILKQEGDMLFSGSFVVSGSCLAQVEHVGKDNYIEKLAIEAKKQKENKSELLRTLNWIIRIIGIIIVPLALFQFYQNYTGLSLQAVSEALQIPVEEITNYDKFAYIIKKVAGSVIGMIPSGLFLLTTVALSAGVYRWLREIKLWFNNYIVLKCWLE